MRGRNIFLAVVVLLIGLFTFENWKELIEPRGLVFLGQHFMGPLGIILMVTIAALVLVYGWYTVQMEQTALREAAKFAKDVMDESKRQQDRHQALLDKLNEIQKP